MGPQAEGIYSQLVMSADEAKNFEKVMEKLDSYFQPQRNVIYERARLNNRVQKPGEAIEQFISDVYALAENCGYAGATKEEQIRDKIVSGILNKDLSRELQMKPDLTLAQAVEMVRHSAMVHEQMNLLSLNANLEEIRAQKPRNPPRKYHKRPQPQTTHQPKKDSMCMRCGKSHSRQWVCPAAKATCNFCHKIGHYVKVCRKRTSNSHRPTTDEVQMNANEEQFLGSIETNQNGEQPWFVPINIVENGEHLFKIDSGADVTVITEHEYRNLKNPPILRPTSKSLNSPGGVTTIIGYFSNRHKTYDFDIYVIKGNGSNLLSRKASYDLGYLKLNIDEVSGISTGLVKCNPVTITLKEGATPFHIHTARKIPTPLLSKVEKELERMQREGVIEPIDEATDWCAPIVVVPKHDNSVRICVDLRGLNKNIKRERYILPTMTDILPKLAGSSVFSKLDAASGYWQLPLDDQSAKLTTFITHKGRYFFRRLPFGIACAAEIFQREMSRILEGVEGVHAYQDDIIIFGKTQEQHDRRLEAVLRKLSSAGLKLNKAKCDINKSELKFLGHVISKSGVSPDPAKVEAIIQMKPPSNITELRQILGMIQYLGQYLPNLAQVLEPINELLRKDTVWHWGDKQQNSLDQIKKLITSSPTLAFFDLNKETVVSADASNYGIGGYLYQKHGEVLKPIAFCSRSLTSAERNYAMIEKECLASTWVCERMEQYLCGLDSFTLVTDHKPLVPLINSQDISRTPARCQRLLLRLMKFNACAIHCPGKEMYVADALSRNPMPITEVDEIKYVEEEVKSYIDNIEENWPATNEKIEQIREATKHDDIIQEVIHYTIHGWPGNRASINPMLHAYHAERANLSCINDILVHGDRIVIPTSLREDILDRLHEGHFGINKCRERASQSVWWPGISESINSKISKCSTCITNRNKQPQPPLITRPLPEYPWQRIGADLFEVNNKHFLVIVDMYSRFIEISYLTTTTATNVIAKIKNSFARFGKVQELFTDNGPQFACAEFAKFAKDYEFKHVTSSPHYPQSNGSAESAVKIAAKIVQQHDPFLALMNYHASPIAATGFSPGELMLNRRMNTLVPCLPENLLPRMQNTQTIRSRDDTYRERMANNYDRRNHTKPLDSLAPGEIVRIRTDKMDSWENQGRVVKQVAPRSYEVETSNGTYRRNRKHLMLDKSDGTETVLPETEPQQQIKNSETEMKSDQVVTRSGRVVKPVNKMNI